MTNNFINEFGGLPHVFSFFMQYLSNANQKKKVKSSRHDTYIRVSSEDTMNDLEQTCQLIMGLLVNASSMALDRVIFKFIEKDFEKLRVLV